MNDTVASLTLYQYRACPFCIRTRLVIDKLPLDIKHNDILINPQYRSELIQQGGRSQVPCLRIEHNNGEVKWLYESIDIIKYAYSLIKA